ncbi:MAG TPA: molybdenum cofactor biosynthesis protein MoaE [Chloroflexota bacterium]|nr:molybdenum cofactor biosynthesis protein MoaE [Chloroflexota bacterium]
MNITVKLFARHREITGQSQVRLDLDDGASVDDAFRALTQRYPALSSTGSFTTFARNRQVVGADTALADGDELALLQPVSGGGDELIEVIEEPLSLDRCVSEVEAPGCGAIVTFIGTVRDNSEGVATDHLEYEAYREMAEEMLRRMAGEARRDWDIGGIAVQHRVGRLEIGEASVVIAISAPHRAEAFAACRHIIERLKADAPIWKKEFGESGEVWVEGPSV